MHVKVKHQLVAVVTCDVMQYSSCKGQSGLCMQKSSNQLIGCSCGTKQNSYYMAPQSGNCSDASSHLVLHFRALGASCRLGILFCRRCTLGLSSSLLELLCWWLRFRLMQHLEAST